METTSLNSGTYTLSELWKQGFGTISANRVLSNTLRMNSVIANVLIANAPQVAVSFVYIFYNNVLTCMLGEHERNKFTKTRKGLHVSKPRGAQRSTFWLQVPYRYIVPLMSTMAVLHWLIARSIFLVKIKVYDINHQPLPSKDVNACGYSTIALVFAVIVGGVLIVALIGISFCRLDGGMRIIGPCSITLSAAASAGAEEQGAARLPLMYGVIEENTGEQVRTRVGFSSKEVTPLVDGVVYT